MDFGIDNRFIAAVAYVIALVAIFLIPDLEGHETELTAQATIVLTVLLARFSPRPADVELTDKKK